MTNSEIIMIALTAVIAAAGVIGACIFNNQLTVMQGQLDEMKSTGQQTDIIIETNKKLAEASKESADATKKAVDLSDRTAARQLRAYVAPKSADIAFRDGNIEVFFELKNSGVTPAYKVGAEVKYILTSGTGLPPFPTHPQPIRGGGIINPGEVFHVTSGADMIKEMAGQSNTTVDDIIARITNKSISAYISARIDYEDVFGRSHALYLRSLAIAKPGGGWALRPEPEGNYEE